MTEHQGLPIPGYRPQSQKAVDAVEQHKLLEEHLLRRCDDLKGSDIEPDGRCLSIAFTKFQEAFMWLNRAVFKPERIMGDLP